MTDIMRICRKEFRGFFATPAAYLFIGAFLVVNLFVFFWVETFFARNIADLRPLFKWMPALLIFLVSALTMRCWSEERRAGTLEILLTAPVRPISLVFGKFCAALALVALALVLTVPLAITVSIMGPLDWGPVIGGYVATLFLAAAYIAIGVYMSGKSDNAIVALILTTLTCGGFYLIGSNALTTLFGAGVGDILARIGTGTRFESITRGVIDARDLYYYLSIVGVFLVLNLLSLEKLRWQGNPTRRRHREWNALTAVAVLNLVVANFWLAPINTARADLTRNHVYSLSEATRRQLSHLREPLAIKGYFSSKTHPLLEPLVPRMKDILAEYRVAAGGNARVDIVDPAIDHDAENIAASKYGVRPVPFQTSDRYRLSVVNSYFDVVIAYGDQYETLNYADLIEVKAHGDNNVEVALRNPEYAIGRAIRKVVNAYRAGGDPFANLSRPVTFEGFISPEGKLPEQLRIYRKTLDDLLKDYRKQAGDMLKISFQDPDADGGQLAERLNKDYGFGPQIASLLDPRPFWFHMLLRYGKETVRIPLSETTDKSDLKRVFDSALRRLAPGYLKTIALVKPVAPPRQNPYAPQPSAPRYDRLEATLAENARVVPTDLKDGRVPETADLLMVLAPDDMNDTQRFAIDQFLMRGGGVVLTTSPYNVEITNTLSATRQDSGLKDWLAHFGIGIADGMVLDPRNASLPIPVEREVGGLRLRQISMVPYPHFPDLRGEELDRTSPVTANLDQLTLNWASPVTIDAKASGNRKVVELLRSSAQSWTSNSANVLPDYDAYPDTGFAPSDDRGARTLAIAVEGGFESFYADRESPLLKSDPKGETDVKEKKDTRDDDKSVKLGGVIRRSPESAKLVVVGSNSFASDLALQLASRGMGTRYSAPLDFMQNAVDWSLEDQSLMALRGRNQFARTLTPIPERSRRIWEYLNYGIALLGLFLVWSWRRAAASSERESYRRILREV